MNKKVLGFGGLVGLLFTAPLIGLLFLAERALGLPFVPFDVFNWISRVLPGPVITFGIDLMIDTFLFLGMNVANTAKTAEQVMAISVFLVMGIGFSLVYFVVVKANKIRSSNLTGLVLGLLFGLPGIVIGTGFGYAAASPMWSMVWLFLIFLAWGWGVNWSYLRLFPEMADTAEPESTQDHVEVLNRRQFLVMLGGAAATVTVVGSGLAAWLFPEDQELLGGHGDSPLNFSSFPNANDPVSPAPGTRPEYTPLKDHYQVFIELEPTVIDGETWRLPITGLVDRPMMLTIDDLRNNYTPREQFVTLSCISGRIGTSLISTTQWTGASLQEVLADAQLQEDAKYLIISSGDGFYETLDLELVAQEPRIMLCYEWDGNPLPVGHGFPLRVWIPDRYGMKQPKWITNIEVTDNYEEGYWVERGWDEVAQVNATSVIDTVAVNAPVWDGDVKRVPVGGIAFAGARQISKVEVRVNGGEWQEAQLRTPLSETTWVIWRIDWPFEQGEHLFEVRCVDGEGTPQIEIENKARPSGSTGVHSYNADI